MWSMDGKYIIFYINGNILAQTFTVLFLDIKFKGTVMQIRKSHYMFRFI